jgi:hypothetical protein
LYDADLIGSKILKLLLNLFRTFLTFVRDVDFIFILSILSLPLLGSVAAGHRTIRFLLLLLLFFFFFFFYFSFPFFLLGGPLTSILRRRRLPSPTSHFPTSPLQLTGFTNISTIFLSFFYLFSKSLLNCF